MLIASSSPSARPMGSPPQPPAQVEAVVAPCSAHRAIQRSGITWTTSQRRHRGQYRGGSSSSRRTQVSCPASAAGRPQWAQ